jgi:hypothetical protein
LDLIYNELWMIQRRGYIWPAQQRRKYYAATAQRAA